MTIGTSLKDRPWNATVFLHLIKISIFCFSREDTRHCQNIKINKYVSVAINQDWGKSGLIKGLQMIGIASNS